jgi:hypothetical protein
MPDLPGTPLADAGMAVRRLTTLPVRVVALSSVTSTHGASRLLLDKAKAAVTPIFKGAAGTFSAAARTFSRHACLTCYSMLFDKIS